MTGIDRNHPVLRMTVEEQRRFAATCVHQCPIEVLEKINWLLVSSLDPGSTQKEALKVKGYKR